MARCGEVYHDQRFEFEDGHIASKLMIVLADGAALLLAALTTSNPKNKKRERGCNNNHWGQYFYLPVAEAKFDQETWIGLEKIWPLDRNKFREKIRARQLHKRFDLHPATMRDILECVLQSEDITPEQERLLQASLDAMNTRLTTKSR